ncbi:MAG TPA: NAD-dependent epimerase/dehydratase family protein [Lacipirellulaceae bacterium]|nr:NAD-dependent epimerase/dehydratase family protein [Lacipirellulaceae bacterium]
MSIQAAQIERVQDVGELEDLLSQPTPRLVELMGRLSGDIAVLGAGGKMGPSLARMAIRASTAAGVARRIFAVSRFSDPHTRRALLEHGVETITGDLLDAKFVASLPSVDHVIYMAGKKFGSIGQESDTWAMNVHLPSIVCERFSHSRIVAFSTGNVYGLVSTQSKGSRETDAPAPIGEYAMSCLGRERIFEYYSRSRGTPTVLLRLNYANELRYGVLVDLARQVWNRQPVDLKMGAVNVIWQGDANALALQSLELAATPARVLNIARPVSP